MSTTTVQTGMPSITFDRDEANLYLDLIFDPHTTGYVAMAFKIPVDLIPWRADRTYNDYRIPKSCKPDDQYGWRERKFAWPSQREQMLDEVADRTAADTVKVMISPALFKTPENRQANNVKCTKVVHIDFDAHGKKMDTALFTKLRKSLKPLIIRSGSPHCFHAYVGVDNMSPAEHDRLGKALVDYFKADSSFRCNVLLSLPGTFNLKNLHPVQIVGLTSPQVWDSVNTVAARLNIDLDAVSFTPHGAIDDVPMDESLAGVAPAMIRRLRRECANGQSSDRSNANFRIVKTCQENGLTPGQTYTFMVTHLDEEDYKFGDSRLAEDIKDIWPQAGKKRSKGPKGSKGSSDMIDDLALGDLTTPDDEILELGVRRLRLTKVSEIQSERRRWLWTHRIPANALTLLAGREGCGKGNLTADLAARITRGEVEGEYKGRPRNVIFMTAEDDYKVDVKPRLKVAGANLDRVFVLDAEIDDETDALSLNEDEDELAAMIRDNDVALLVLDPIKSALGESVDAEKEKGLRRALERLNRMAGECDCSVLGIMHFNKRDSGDAGVLMSGLLVWSQVARMTLGMIRHPENQGEFILGNGKSNGAPATVGSLHYKIVGVPHRTDDGEMTEVSKVELVGKMDESLHQMMTPETASRGKANEVQTWLIELLTERGSIAVTDVLAQGKSRGYGQVSIRAAHKAIHAQTHWPLGKGPGSKSFWSLLTSREGDEDIAAGLADADIMKQLSLVLSIDGNKLYTLTQLKEEAGINNHAEAKAAIQELIAHGYVKREKTAGRSRLKFIKLFTDQDTIQL